MDIPIKRGEENTENEPQDWVPSQSFEAFGKLQRLEKTPETPEEPADTQEAVAEQAASTRLFDWILKGSIWMALFLVPLFYFASSDTLGFAKSLLISTLALVALSAWTVKVIVAGKSEGAGGKSSGGGSCRYCSCYCRLFL